jgi:hypothetical protein
LPRQLPDSFKDFANKYTGSKKLKADLLSHCRRECIHAQWRIILDEEFLDAYEHGIVIECCDGITRRFYPRIFTYSADYPEKYGLSFSRHQAMTPLANRVLLACIRNLGGCPCPRCTIRLSDVHLVGTKRDRDKRITMARIDDEHLKFKISRARELIYQDNYAVDSAGVERLLKPLSLVPTEVTQPVHQPYDAG